MLFLDETFDFRGLKINYVFSILATVFKNRFFFNSTFWPCGLWDPSVLGQTLVFIAGYITVQGFCIRYLIKSSH